MHSIFLLTKDNPAVKAWDQGVKTIVTDDTIGSALLCATIYQQKPQKIVLLAANLYAAQKIYDFISSLLGEEECLFYPVDDLMRFEALAASKEMLAQRLFVMDGLLKKETYILITHTTAAMKYLPSPSLFQKHCLKLKRGGVYSLEELKKVLSESGYQRVNKIDHSLQFASRGDILDIYSVNLSSPVRIEFFDEEIESIRSFHVGTQTSFEELEEIEILPAQEYIFSNEEMDEIGEKIRKEAEKDKRQLKYDLVDWFSKNIEATIEKLEDNSNYIERSRYFGFLQKQHYSILDYAVGSKVAVLNRDAVEKSSEIALQESIDFILHQFDEGNLLSHLSLYQEINRVLRGKHVVYTEEFAKDDKDVVFAVRGVTGSASHLEQAKNLIERYLGITDHLILSLNQMQQYSAIVSMLENENIEFEKIKPYELPNGKLGVCLGMLEEGFELVQEKVAYLTSHELFRYQNPYSRFTNRYKQAVVLKSEQDLSPGDYVVHEAYGIGKFLDIKTMEVDGMHRDYLHIQYAGTDVLYVPLEQFKLVRKYVGKDGAAPKLNKLGSSEWEKTKKRIKERINEMADRLFRLYAERSSVDGYAFAKDDELQEQFESQFTYELTADQRICLDEIKKDMERPVPMDRLLCGDVGFGKTELAFRAAFKAISSGKQVAILCPTTLLARQHYEVALERFHGFGVNIAILSRLIDETRQKEYIRGIEDGTIHLTIGTHRILSKKLHFKELGLLIVDEEQRFGVEQKERIKELKTNIDVLTLTATPIPRTLQMSLLGIRPLSQINTPPGNRMPIQTYVTPQDSAVIKELICRELARKGQVFYLHNNISTIYSKATKLQKAIPSARIGVAHGRMGREEIEDIMLHFYQGELDVLVCTSIIETGIDIPNVNMMIIEDADKFGLSQLYQIKGRVGRGNRIAYAYLLYKPNKVMSDVAKKRLKAITDFTELGSGYKIAQRDLLIRGAGDILGPEQAGFIDTVGMDLYLNLLNEAIQERKEGKIKEVESAPQTLNLDAYLPTEYVDKSDKIELYHEIDEAKTLEDLEKLKEKIRDIYGRIPEEVTRLLQKRRIRIWLEDGETFSSLQERKEYVELYLSKKLSEKNGVGITLFQVLTPFLSYIKVTFVQRTIKIKWLKNQPDWFEKMEKAMEFITQMKID